MIETLRKIEEKEKKYKESKYYRPLINNTLDGIKTISIEEVRDYICIIVSYSSVGGWAFSIPKYILTSEDLDEALFKYDSECLNKTIDELFEEISYDISRVKNKLSSLQELTKKMSKLWDTK